MASEVGKAYLSILPSTKGFAANLGKDLDGPFNQAGMRGGDQIGDGVGKSKGFASAGVKAGGIFLAAFAAVGLAQAAGAIKDFLSDSITAGSDLNETTSKTGEIFGSATDKVLEFSKTTASALGQSQQQALDGAATFGIFAKSAGLSEDASADFSTQLVTLAGDMASFNNTSPEDAINAIGSALRGEAEPIRNYGVLLDDATLKARAMSMGLIQTNVDQVKVAGSRLKLTQATKDLAEAQKKHGESSDEYAVAQQKVTEAQQALEKAVQGTTDSALTPQQKVLAAHAEILAQTTTAQGDFERTSGGLANQQRILTAELENTKAEIGTALLPVVTDLFKTFSEVGVPALQDLATWFTENQDTVRSTAIAIVDGGLLMVQAILGIGSAALRVEALWLGWVQNMTDMFFFFVRTVVDGAAQAFGWIPGLGPKLQTASDDLARMQGATDFAFDAMQQSALDTAEKFDEGSAAVQELRDKVLALDGTKATVTLTAQGNLTRHSDGSYTAPNGVEFRAGGGDVTAGRPYIVGENEAELFVPGQSGHIYNQRQLASMGSGDGGGSGVQQTNYFTGLDADAALAAMDARLRVAMQQ